MPSIDDFLKGSSDVVAVKDGTMCVARTAVGALPRAAMARVINQAILTPARRRAHAARGRGIGSRVVLASWAKL